MHLPPLHSLTNWYNRGNTINDYALFMYNMQFERETGMIKAGIIGATGYAGNELVRILMNHPEVEIAAFGSKSYEGEKYSDIFRNMTAFTEKECVHDSIEEMSEYVDVVFTATPQGYCAGELTDKALANAKIIDLSADFRLKDVSVYEQWYKLEHKRPDLLPEAVYGLCEINRGLINKDVRIIANPGCYTTTSILALYPAVKSGIINPDSIIIDAKSGTSGAGRGAKLPNLFCEVNESIKPYGVGTHRHTPEIEEQLGYAAGKNINLIFTPHLVPMERGILVTAYADLVTDISSAAIRTIYNSHYGKEKFIRVLEEGVFPETRFTKCSNFVDVNFRKDERTGRLVVMATLDNLIKGAAGQAVQNMNLLFGLPEDTGLNMIPVIM